MSSYVIVYYTVSVISLAAIAASMLLRLRHKDQVAINTYIFAIITITYLATMLRRAGVDYGSYLVAYYTNPSTIPDYGFQWLIYFFNLLGLPFEAMVFLFGIVTLLSLRRAARYFSVNFILLLLLYFMHLAVVRDFAQLRSGFAMALVVIGLTHTGKFKKGAFYLIASSMHLSSTPFAASYEFCRWITKKRGWQRQWVIMAGAVVGVFVLGSSVQHLDFIDARISIYIRWEQENYGMPVGRYLILYFHLAILGLSLLNRRSWEHNERIRTLFYLQIIGVAVFIAFASTSIFAFRISSAVLTLYPVLFIYSLVHLRVRVNGYYVSNVIAAIILIIVAFVFLMRPGTLQILNSVAFSR